MRGCVRPRVDVGLAGNTGAYKVSDTMAANKIPATAGVKVTPLCQAKLATMVLVLPTGSCRIKIVVPLVCAPHRDLPFFPRRLSSYLL